jgi:hypothetical protein
LVIDIPREAVDSILVYGAKKSFVGRSGVIPKIVAISMNFSFEVEPNPAGCGDMKILCNGAANRRNAISISGDSRWGYVALCSTHCARYYTQVVPFIRV